VASERQRKKELFATSVQYRAYIALLLEGRVAAGKTHGLSGESAQAYCKQSNQTTKARPPLFHIILSKIHKVS